MADPTHSLSRLWLRQRREDGVAHISPGCKHSWGKSLCGVPAEVLNSDEGVSSLCPTCLQAWRDDTGDSGFPGTSVMLPRGDVFVLKGASGDLHRGPLFGSIERRAQAITQGLRPLSPESLGHLGVMDASRGPDGLLHGDRWCVEYDESNVEAVPVSMRDDSVAPHCEGSPLHCQRSLPQNVEDGFFAALAVCRARNGVLAVMEHSGWGLHEAVRHERGMHGASDQFVCENGAYEVRSSLSSSAETLSDIQGAPSALAREHERTSEVWNAVKRVMDNWGSSAEARAELGRVTILLALAAGDTPPSADASNFQALVQYGITDGARLAIINVCQARIALGNGEWISPLPANKTLVLDEVLPRLEGVIPPGREDEVAEDLADFMVSQDHAFCAVSERHMRDDQVGVLLEANPALIPEHWGQWPQGEDGHGRTLNWVPSPVAKVTPLEALEASPAPFLPMTCREAQSLLSSESRTWTR